MELSDKKFNTFQKGILQKYFSLTTYGFCIIATPMLSLSSLKMIFSKY